MKSIILLLATLFCSYHVNAEEISSSFGFSINIPEDWTPLTAEEIKNNPDLFDLDKVKGLSPELLNQVKPMILSGKTEIFFMPDVSSNFADNVNIIKQIGQVPASPKEIESLCKSLPGQLTSMFKHPIKMYKCEIRNIDNIASLYLEFDGAIVGTRSMQYQIPKSKNVHLVVTATIKNSTLGQMGDGFHAVMKTFKVK